MSRVIPPLAYRCALLTSVTWLVGLQHAIAGPTFTPTGGIKGPGYSVDANGNAVFTSLTPGIMNALPLFASGGSLDMAGSTISGGTPSAAPTSNTLGLSCLPSGFPGGAFNVRNHAQLCIQGIASKYGNNGIYVNGQLQSGPNAYNDNDYMVTMGLDVQPGANNAVALYGIAQGEAGAPQFWAVNTVTQLQPGFTNNAFGYELDMNNQSGRSGNTNYGFWATGASSTTNYSAYNATGVAQSGPLQWHFGYVAQGSIDTADFVSTSTAADSVNILGSHGGSGLKLKGGVFGTSAVDLATDPSNGVPQSIRWSDQNGGNYGTWKIEVDKTSEADSATALAFDVPLGAMTVRYDGSLFLRASAGSGGNLSVPGAASIGGTATVGGINASGTITTSRDLQTTGGNVDLSPGKAVALGVGGSSPAYLGGDGNSNALLSGNLTVTGNLTVADTKSLTFSTNTASPCYFFHDDSAQGLVYQCGGTRLMRIPDNGSAPIFKTAPVAGTP